MSTLLRKGDESWSWSATPTKMLKDRVVGNVPGGEFPTKEDALVSAKSSIDQWLFRHQ